jgi:hypothetical protein
VALSGFSCPLFSSLMVADSRSVLSASTRPELEFIEMFQNNELLDSLWFRMGVHTVAFWSWVAACCVLLAVR